MTTTTSTPFYASLGSVSSGTLRPEDLIPCFVELLNELKEQESLSKSPNKDLYSSLDDVLGPMERRIELDGYYESEESNHDLDWLFGLLDAYAPPFSYFGAHVGDGCDYGFWLSEDSVMDAIHDGDILKLDAGDEWPTELPAGCYYVLEVTDHGNMTLFDASNRREIWGVV